MMTNALVANFSLFVRNNVKNHNRGKKKLISLSKQGRWKLRNYFEVKWMDYTCANCKNRFTWAKKRADEYAEYLGEMGEGIARMLEEEVDTDDCV